MERRISCGTAFVLLVATSGCSGSGSAADRPPMDDGASGGTSSSGASSGSSGSSSADSSGIGSRGDGGNASEADTEAATSGTDASEDTASPAPDVLAMMRKVADWQLAQPGVDANDWIHGAMWAGILATYQATGDVKYLAAVKAWGQGNGWGLSGGVTTNADNQCAAPTYFDVYLTAPGAGNSNMVTGAKLSFDAMVAAGNAGWTWEDALFMSPPGLTRLGVIEGDSKYFALLDANWWKAYASLFVPADGLMCRDPGCNGVYWGRGNGWVVAGTARVLEFLPPSDARVADYVAMLATMAAALKPWQGADGLWRSDITNPARYPNPETSGTGLITYAVAWAINHGMLDRATYAAVAQKGWQGLVGAVGGDGMLGYVQPVGAGPAPATATSTPPNGVGAFLLASSKQAQLKKPGHSDGRQRLALRVIAT